MNEKITVVIPTYNHPNYIQYLIEKSINDYNGKLFEFSIHDSSENNLTKDVIKNSKHLIAYYKYDSTISADLKVLEGMKKVNTSHMYLMGDGCLPNFNKFEQFLKNNNFNDVDVLGLVDENVKKRKKLKLVSYESMKSIVISNLDTFLSEFMYILTYYGSTIISSNIINEILRNKFFDKYTYKGRNCYSYVSSMMESLLSNNKFVFNVSFVNFIGTNPLKKVSTWIKKEVFFDILISEFQSDVEKLPLLSEATKKKIIMQQRFYAFNFSSVIHYRLNNAFDLTVLKKYKEDYKKFNYHYWFLFLTCFIPVRFLLFLRRLKKIIKKA